MPPIDRREYLKYSGSAAFTPLVAATNERAANAAGRDEHSNPSGGVLPPRNLRVEYAKNPLGVQAQSRPDSARPPGDDSDEDEEDQQDERPGADWTDYAFESRFTVESRAAGFAFRAQDPGNFYLWQIIVDAEVLTAEPANAILRTHTYESGLPVVRENVPFTLGDVDAQHTCRIDLEGPQITTYVDGEMIHTTVDATYESGTVGFRTDVTQAEHVLVDEVTVVDRDGEELFATNFSYDSVRYFSGGTIVNDQLSLQADDVVLRADRESSTEPDPPLDGEPDHKTGRPRPRLSWEFDHAYRGQSQHAYQVLVASSEQRLRADRADKWDSGKVTASDSIHVAYEGEPLASGERVYWKVRVWDEDDRVSNWSDIATWEMGLLDESDWQADWIGSPQHSQHQRLDEQWVDYTVEATFTVGDGPFGVPFIRPRHRPRPLRSVPKLVVTRSSKRTRTRRRGPVPPER